MKKNLILVSVVSGALLLVGAGCASSSAPVSYNNQPATNNQPTTTANTGTDIAGLMNSMKSASGLNFSNSEPNNLSWIIQNQKGVGGQMMQASNITDTQEKTVESYLISQGFRPDPINSFVSDTSTASIGYTNGSTVCSINGQLLNPGYYNLKITCGNL
ncbi:MAG: hypothetical protein WC526_03515 [Patescibacteria group bacterium]